jgi:hypothetical protein
MKLKSAFYIFWLFSLAGFLLSTKAAQSKEIDLRSDEFQHISQNFKDNKCPLYKCEEIARAAGATASFDQGVYKIYATKKSLDSAIEDLNSHDGNAYSTPIRKENIRRLEAELKSDLENVRNLYGVKNIKDISIIDESKDFLSSANGTTGGFAIVIRKEEEGKVSFIVSIKGTNPKSSNDIFSDLDSSPINIEDGEKGRFNSVNIPNVKVPRGFQNYAKTIINDRNETSLQMISEIKSRQAQGLPVEVIVTGHSLGGASAVIYAAMLQDRGVATENTKVITFAAPPSANQQEYVAAFPQLSANILRVQDPGDAVIDLPIYTSLENAENLPIFGKNAKQVINDYHKYYLDQNRIDNGEDPFKYGILMEGKQQDKTLLNKINKLREFRKKITGKNDQEIWSDKTIRQDYFDLIQIIKDENMLDLTKLEGLGFVAETIANNLNPFGNLFPTLKDILFTHPFESDFRPTASQINSQLTSAIDFLRLKNIKNKADIHIKYSDYYTYGNEAFLNSTKSSNDRKLVSSMQDYSSCITQVNSSHIGSASCFIISSNHPVQDEIITQFQETQGINTSIQKANQYTNGQIVRAPLDIGLTWNQSTNLDLDSHLVTPSEQHIYYSEPGALNAAPNAFLYRDSIPPGRVGAEQTRIDVFQAGIYRFYVHNFSDYTNSPAAQAAGPAGLANANAEVRLYEGGSPLTNIPNDPNTFDLNNPNVQKVGNAYPSDSTFVSSPGQQGNTWYVFRLDTRTGILTRVNQYGSVASPATVPQFAPSRP